MNTFHTSRRHRATECWKRRFAHGTETGAVRIRSFAAAGYLVRGEASNQLVPVERMVFVVLYDEYVQHDRKAIRITGYGASQTPWGVSWGGEENCKFFKDLSLEPRMHAKGQHLDLRRRDALQLGIRLDGCLDKAIQRANRALKLPTLWAAFESADASRLSGNGPEFEQACDASAMSPETVFNAARRDHDGLSLYPLDWVSCHWQRFVHVYADLTGFPKHQVFRLRNVANDLSGFHGASQFDFFHSRFRRGAAADTDQQQLWAA